jgi:hypothetical protein
MKKKYILLAGAVAFPETWIKETKPLKQQL